MECAQGVLIISFSFVLLTSAQVSWYLNTTEVRLEETDTIKLVCTVTGTCCNSNRIWLGGIGFGTLMSNGLSPNPSKYEETIDASANQFSLLIHNVILSDVNVDYQCNYGFDSSTRRQLFLNESIFRYVTQSNEISLLDWTDNGTLFVALNVTRVFPTPSCAASYKETSLSPTVTTYDNNLFKYSKIILQNVEYDCPGTLNITCYVGSYPFPVLNKSPCPTTTTAHSTSSNLHTTGMTSSSTTIMPYIIGLILILEMAY